MDHAGRTLMLFRALLAVPALVILASYWTSANAWPGDVLRPTGEWSARLIIAALALTPLARLLPGNRAIRWLVRNRRSIGVAAFGYALVHLIFYILDMESIANMLAELRAPAIWTGWLAFLCLLVPALISNDAAMRGLKKSWKRLQKLAYLAALLTLAHWLLVHDGRAAALAHFAPLVLLQLLRLGQSLKLTDTERKIA